MCSCVHVSLVCSLVCYRILSGVGVCGSLSAAVAVAVAASVGSVS